MNTMTTQQANNPEKATRKYIRSKEQLAYYAKVMQLAVKHISEHLDLPSHKLIYSVRDRACLYGRELIYYILREFGSSLRVTSDLFEYNCNISHISQMLAGLDKTLKEEKYKAENEKLSAIIEKIKTELENGSTK